MRRGSTAGRRVLVVLVVMLAVFAIARAGLLVCYPRDFHGLTAMQVLSAFGRGVLFDLSVICTLAGFPLLMLLLPFRWAAGHRWQAFWGWSCFALLLGMVTVLAGDLIYFGVVHRHAGPEILALGNDLRPLLEEGWGDHGRALLAAIGFQALLLLLWRRILSCRRVQPAAPLTTLAVLALLLVGIRGPVLGKPMGIVDAFSGGSSAAGYLILNGPFCTLHSLGGNGGPEVRFFPWNQALATVRADVLEPGEVGVDPNYPLERRRASPAAVRANVVVIMLESWDAAHVDALRLLDHQPPLGATPEFDALSRQGLLFSNFYANGQRSMDGMAALLAGIPTLPGMPYLGCGLEQSGMSFLGNLGRSQGYRTIFLQGSVRRSFRVDAIAPRAGFERYLGAEDIPTLVPGTRLSDRGAPDDATLQAANRVFAATDKPFVGFIFTASTHGPYLSPGPEWRKFPDNSLENRYLNTLNYADWALGRFFAAARKEPYFAHTIFVVTGDHVSGFRSHADDLPTLHHIPALIIAPDISPAVVDTTASQVDVLPTIVELAHWPVPYAGLGSSLIPSVQAASRGALVVEGQEVSRIEAGGWVSHDLHSRLAGRSLRPGVHLDGIEQRLLSGVEVTTDLLRRNRFYWSPGGGGGS